MDHDVFISHSSKNKTIADRICWALEMSDISCWIAPRNISSGESWPEAITRAVETSTVMVLIFSKNANTSKDVANEIILAMKTGVPVVPIKIDQTTPKGVFQYYLAGAQWEYTPGNPSDYQLQNYVIKVKQIIDSKKKLSEAIEEAERRSIDTGSNAVLSKKDFYKQVVLSAIIYSFLIMAVLSGYFYYYGRDWLDRKILLNNTIAPIEFPVSGYWVFTGKTKMEIDEDNLKAGNIINNGLVVEFNDAIYFINSDEGNKLSVVNLVDNKTINLTEDQVFSINVHENWVYYINSSQYNQIYKVSTDGTANQRIVEDPAELIYFENGWIYYINIAHRHAIYKIKRDGSERTRLTMDHTSQFFIDDDWLYFKNENHGGFVYRVGKDGSELTQINNEYSKHFNVQGDWLYYINGFDDDRIYRIMTDGSKKAAVSKASANYIHYKDEWIYYTNNDDGGRIYRIRTDGSKNTKISDHTSGKINLVSNWLYFVNRYGNDRIDRINLDSIE
jgi:hypothetical protein